MASIIDSLLHRGKAVVTLTDLGTQKHDEMAVDGVRLDVLVYLKTNGASSEREIADNIHLDQPKVHKIVNEMMNEGWVEAKGK
jgi:Sugar-specific transcriptional regulator TrmB.